MQLVLVSSCLLGRPVRYNAIHKRCDSEVLARWQAQGLVVPVCPEVSGGLARATPCRRDHRRRRWRQGLAGL
jgi:uncharacterized protein YbbK (DUF523 family)